MFKSLKEPWDLMRVARLIMGISGVAFAFVHRDVLLGVAGGYFALMSLLNVGCCGTGGCSVPVQRNKTTASDTKAEPASFQEVQ